MKKYTILALTLACIGLSTLNAVDTQANKSKRPVHKKSHTSKQVKQRKKKKNNTVLGSTLGLGGVGALAAGVAGSGKWVPLGLVGGALAGYAVGKIIEHNRNKQTQNVDEQINPSKSNKKRIKKQSQSKKNNKESR